MTQIGYGLPTRLDAPLPVKPEFGLLPAAAAPAAGVRIIPEGDERWINGAELYPFSPDIPDVHDPCAGSGPSSTKGFGTAVHKPRFGALTLHLDVTCTAAAIPSQEEYKARAVAAFEAVESAGVAQEILGGYRIPSNPHLADGTGEFPNGDAATSVKNAVALLEGEIAKSGKLGLIHCSPMAATIAREFFAIDVRAKVVRTINGNVVINDAGYFPASEDGPNNKSAPAANEEWMYATGPLDIRRSEIIVVPGNVSEALDRGTGGATNDRPNSITYRVERYYLVTWDPTVHAAVRVDRCKTTC